MRKYRYRFAIAELLCWTIYSLVALGLFYMKPSWLGLIAMLIGVIGMTRYADKVLKTLKLL